MNNITIGKKFKLQKFVTQSVLESFGYEGKELDWILKQKYFVCVKGSNGYERYQYTWFNSNITTERPFKTDWVEIFDDKGYNHPLSPIFK